jgi:beta-lactamase regulating signal transducer with metallopeptidase domain
LLLVGGLFLAGLAVLAARGVAPADALESCREAATMVVERVALIGLVTPAAVVAVVLLSAVLALIHQLWATHGVMSRVLARRVTAADRVTAAARSVGFGAVDVVADTSVFTFCYGFRSPRVCVSTGLVDLLDDAELRAVLRHEAHHARHRDPLKILVSRTVASGLFFLPLAGALRNSFLARKEICADAEASQPGNDFSLARALVKMLKADRPTWPAGVLAIGAISPTEARIQHLLEPDAVVPQLPSAVDWIVSAALVAGIFGFSYGSAHAAPDMLPQTACNNAQAYALPEAHVPISTGR